MKRTVKQIVETISKEIDSKRLNATGGAKSLEEKLEVFIHGLKKHDVLDFELEVDVPLKWQKYFFTMN